MCSSDLKESAQQTLFERIEMPLVAVLSKIERTGVRVDCDMLATQSGRAQAMTNRILLETLGEAAKSVFNDKPLRVVVKESFAKLLSEHMVFFGDEPAPAPDDEYLIYQTLVGAWPEVDGRPSEPGAAWLDGYRDRLEGYARKAVREAKRRSSWSATFSATSWASSSAFRISLMLTKISLLSVKSEIGRAHV